MRNAEGNGPFWPLPNWRAGKLARGIFIYYTWAWLSECDCECVVLYNVTSSVGEGDPVTDQLSKYRVSQKCTAFKYWISCNYARDVHAFGVIRKRVSWKLLCFGEVGELISCHEAAR